MPHRDTNALVPVRVPIRPVKPQLAAIGIHVPNNRVAAHRFVRLCLIPLPFIRIRKEVYSNIHKPHVGQIFMLDFDYRQTVAIRRPANQLQPSGQSKIVFSVPKRKKEKKSKNQKP